MTELSNNIFLSDGKLGHSLKHGSLFSGIGGFDLAAEWMGWENVLHCEWNEFGRKVLKHYWPKSKSYEDITKTDFNIYRGKIDILTGGFPCQPYSSAGKRLGKEDDRHLWPEMLRAIREIAPKYVVGENVSGLLSWNGGLVFNEVQADLENEGYEVQPCVLPAAAVNAPHRRDRIWFVAYANNPRTNEQSGINGNRQKENKGWKEQPRPEFGENSRNWIDTNTNGQSISKEIERGREISSEEREAIRNEHKTMGGTENATNTYSTMRERWEKGNKSQEGSEPNEKQFRRYDKLFRKNFEKFPSKPPICSRDDGLPDRLDGITFPKWRNESIKAYGNAIVPQIALNIFKSIMETQKKINVY